MIGPCSEAPSHCWHATSGFSHETGGVDNSQCCHCSLRVSRKWYMAQDPDHGKFGPLSKKVYEDA